MKIYRKRNVVVIVEEDGSLNYLPQDKVYYGVDGNSVTINTRNGVRFLINDITEIFNFDDIYYTDINTFVEEVLVRIPIPSKYLSYEKLVLYAFNTTNQTPSAAEIPMIINWNTIAYIDNEYIEVLPSGIIVSKKAVKIRAAFVGNVSRAGAGRLSESYGRVCQNGVQMGGSLESSLDGSNDKKPLIDTSYFTFTNPNGQLKYEFYNEGFNRGALESKLPSLYPTWSPVYSSSIVIYTNDGLV